MINNKKSADKYQNISMCLISDCVWSILFNLISINMNLIGRQPISKYSIIFGVDFPASRILLNNCSSDCSKWSMSFFPRLYQVSEFDKIEFRNRSSRCKLHQTQKDQSTHPPTLSQFVLYSFIFISSSI